MFSIFWLLRCPPRLLLRCLLGGAGGGIERGGAEGAAAVIVVEAGVSSRSRWGGAARSEAVEAERVRFVGGLYKQIRKSGG